MGIILVGGPSSVGKSTLTKALAEFFNAKSLHMFRRMQQYADENKISRQQKLENWDSLQFDFFCRDIVPIAQEGLLVIDTHFSFQPAGGIDVAFAKHGFNPQIPHSTTLSSEVLRLLEKERIHAMAVLLLAPPEIIQFRQMGDGQLVQDIVSIKAEREAEYYSWIEIARVLGSNTLRVENIGSVESVLAHIVNKWRSN